MVARVRVQTPTARHLTKLNAAFCLLKALLKGNKRFLHLRRVNLKHVSERQDPHRLVGDEQHRLDGAFKPPFIRLGKRQRFA